MKCTLWSCLREPREALSLYVCISTRVQVTIVNIALATLVVPAVHGGSRFELGQIQQATPVTRGQYVVPVTVSADGYSTFSASIYASAHVMQGIEWQTIERQDGVNVIISVATPIVTPEKITLTARYQGRERTQEYWLQPTVVLSQPNMAEEMPVDRTGQRQANNAKPQEETKCRELLIAAGSLYTNVERLTTDCGYQFGIWHPGNSEHLIDWIVADARLLENSRGAAGLLDILKENYGLLGVMRREGGDNYIDYHELPGGESGGETR